METSAFSDLLTPEQLVARLPIFTITHWGQMRSRGDGPAFMRLGNRILYREADVLAWLEERKVRSAKQAKAEKREREQAQAAG